MAKKSNQYSIPPAPKRNKDIASEAAFPTLGSQDSAFGDMRSIDDTYDYTQQSLPGRMGGDPRLKRAQAEHVVHKPKARGQ